MRFADILEMADRHVIYKRVAKEVAMQQGLAVTFMAKFDERYAGQLGAPALELVVDGRQDGAVRRQRRRLQR